MKKSILITGSTDGIGKLAAAQLAAEGHKICLHGRKPEKLVKVISEIKEHTGSENIDGFVADFSDLDAVNKMAATVLGKAIKIDVLINNAGVFKSPVKRTRGGFDIRFTVNYLAPYLLTKILVPVLAKENGARVINLSSAAQAPVDLHALTGKGQLPTQESYAQSKLALTMWSFHLAKAEPDIAVIALNPGSLLNTNMVREGYGRYWSPAAKGGNIICELAIAEEYDGVSGKYFDNDKGTAKGAFGRAHEDAYDLAKIERLIEVTDSILLPYSGNPDMV